MRDRTDETDVTNTGYRLEAREEGKRVWQGGIARAGNSPARGRKEIEEQ